METSGPEPDHRDTKTMSLSTNNDGASLANNMKRLSFSTAMETPLPPSSPVRHHAPMPNGDENLSPSPGANRSAKPPLRRAPSTSSLGYSERSTTPTLHKRTSLSSLQGASAMTPPRSPAIRRTSSHFSASPNTMLGARSSLPPPVEEAPRLPPTAASVAQSYFKKELEMHDAGTGMVEGTQTVVILQDDCYGHRYSRPRTSRANLSTIVERPERIHASILGLATAYVRLGGRHAEGPAAPHPRRLDTALPPAPFKIQKTARRMHLRSPAATALHGTQWMEDLVKMCEAAESKLAMNGKELTRPNASGSSEGSNHSERAKLHEGDLYLCSGSLDALEGALGGVCEGVDAVFKDYGPKRAFVCIRPPGHHCSADVPSGFCWLNNVHVGIRHAVLAHGLTHAAIIDFDLHHGDGSQSITWAHNSRVSSLPRNTPLSKKTAIGYFSMHDINSYPCEEGDDEKVRNASLCIENAHGQNIWNVHLQSWKTEAEFWELYEDKYLVILTKARNFLRLHSEKLRQAPTHPKPKAAIFLSAGFDASEWESPGMQRHQVNVPTAFYARFSSDVVAMAQEEGLGVDGRVISVLEGGYSDRALMSGVLSHLSGLTKNTALTHQPNGNNGVDSEMGRSQEPFNNNEGSDHRSANGTDASSKMSSLDWWSLPRLEEVETMVNPPVIVAPKKQRNESRPTYTSSTQSYTAKIVSPPSARRSLSGTGATLQQSTISRPPTPPPPAVDWVTAAHELSKLLIPSDRETRSCKPEDLNAEASRARRDRYSTIGAPTSTDVPAPVIDAKRMQLRDRRGKVPQYVSEDEEEKPSSRSSRRKTIADVSLLNEDSETSTQHSAPQGAGAPIGHARRRSSIASNASSMNAEKGSDFSLGSGAGIPPKRQPPIVKKSRATANHQVGATKPKAVKSKPPIPRFPSTSSAISTPDEYQTPLAPSLDRVQAPVSVNNDSKNRDMDQLASGMRTMSIKLNVPPKEEYEAREKKPKVAPRGRPSKPSAGKAASPTKAKVKVIKDRSPLISPPIEPLPLQQLPSPAIAAGLGPGPENPVPSPPASVQPLQPAATETPTVTSTMPTSSMASPSLSNDLPHADMNLARAIPTNDNLEKNNQALTPKPVSQAAEVPEQLPQNTTSPTTPVTARRTKQDLPVFTSTSPISFGKSNAIPSSIEQTMHEDRNTISGANQNSPTSISKQPPTTGLAPLEGNAPIANQPLSRSPVEKPLDERTPTNASASMWDIPDTPQPRKP